MKAFALLALVLAGCAQVMLVHPTKTAQDFERDKYDCEQYVMVLGDVIGARGHMLRCLEKKHGWHVQQEAAK